MYVCRIPLSLSTCPAERAASVSPGRSDRSLHCWFRKTSLPTPCSSAFRRSEIVPVFRTSPCTISSRWWLRCAGWSGPGRATDVLTWSPQWLPRGRSQTVGSVWGLRSFCGWWTQWSRWRLPTRVWFSTQFLSGSFRFSCGTVLIRIHLLVEKCLQTWNCCHTWCGWLLNKCRCKCLNSKLRGLWRPWGRLNCLSQDTFPKSVWNGYPSTMKRSLNSISTELPPSNW